MTVEIDNKIIKYQELLNDRDPKKRLNNLELVLRKESGKFGRKQLIMFLNYFGVFLR